MSLFNLGLEDVARKALADADISIDSIFEEEPDAGLGNGGLGRLAACYLDGMATTGICGTGYSILYEYGIFKQKIVDGWQQERADNWLPGGQVWLKSHPDQAVEVRFDGEIHENWDQRLPLYPAHQLQQRHGCPLRYVCAGLRRQGRGKAAPVAGQGPRF